MYFYHGQAGQFRSTDAIHNAAVNITGWLIAHDFRNLIVDVANEYDLPGARERFDAENRSGCAYLQYQRQATSSF
jgi:hypothetical protein